MWLLADKKEIGFIWTSKQLNWYLGLFDIFISLMFFYNDIVCVLEAEYKIFINGLIVSKYKLKKVEVKIVGDSIQYDRI